MKQHITWQEARDLLLELARPLPPEPVPLTEAGGRVLAQKITAKTNTPPFAKAAFDGYAFQNADLAGASREHPVTLQVTEEIAAGQTWTVPVTPGTAAKILTGAPVPEGADTVCKYEDTRFTPEEVTFFQPYKTGENVIPIGEDIQAGEVLATPGQLIDPAVAGLLASQGISAPLVYPVPRIGIISTGTELAEPGKEAGPAQIINTNRYTFQTALRQIGCEGVYLGSAGDSVEDIAALMETGFQSCDAVLSTGGVSAGDYDLTPDALTQTGAELLVRTLRVKPGGACAFGRKGDKLALCLSGNPAAALVNFYAVVLPVLRKLRGLASPALTPIQAVLKYDYPKRSNKPRLVRGRLEIANGHALMVIEGGQGNGVLSSMVGCDLIAELPAGSPPQPAGAVVNAWLLH